MTEIASPCVIFPGAKQSKGYGVLRVGNKTLLAHRHAWQQAHPEEPIGSRLVLHRCDNPPCWNVEHLFLGSARDNTQDMLTKGRCNSGVRQTERTHCPKGHPYDEINTRHYARRRHCRECARSASRRWKEEHVRC